MEVAAMTPIITTVAHSFSTGPGSKPHSFFVDGSWRVFAF
jgi:hypothetical protein